MVASKMICRTLPPRAASSKTTPNTKKARARPATGLNHVQAKENAAGEQAWSEPVPALRIFTRLREELGLLTPQTATVAEVEQALDALMLGCEDATANDNMKMTTPNMDASPLGTDRIKTS